MLNLPPARPTGDNQLPSSTTLRGGSVTSSPSLCGDDRNVFREYSIDEVRRLASLFDMAAPLEISDFPCKGNIHQQTFLIVTGRGGSRKEYLLQRINQQVFTRPRSVMRAMLACVREQQGRLADGILGTDEEWETITLIPTRKGTPYLEVADQDGSSCWRLMLRIAEANTFRSLSEIADPAERLRIAEEAGRGLALFGQLTWRMNTSRLASPLPGYRNTKLYFDQFFSVLAENRTLGKAAPYLPSSSVERRSTGQHFLVHIPPEEYRRRMHDPELQRFLQLVRQQEDFAMTLVKEMESGAIRRVAIHGDTKLDNFLFSTRTGRVKALVDLDTIMSHTWLVDWGDMVRSLVNIAGENERDLGKIQMDMEIFVALARGFLRSARNVTSHEVSRMADAAQILALELGVRFLADYLRGDSYFRLSPANPRDSNKVRAMVQLTLFERMCEKAQSARHCIESLRSDNGRNRCKTV
jgi:hypothetical protein